MKILMTSETFLPLVGGGEIHVRELVHNLISCGNQVTLITNQEGEGHDFEYNVIRIPWRRKNIFKLISSLWRHSSEVEIIHSHYSHRLAAMAMLVARLRGKPGIVTLHGMGTLNEVRAKFPYKQVHSIYRFISLNLATHVISTSEDIAQVARQHMLNTNKVGIIFNGVDIAQFNPEVKVSKSLREQYDGKRIVLTVRRLVPKNGIQFLIEAMPLVAKKVPNVKYLVIGTGRLEDYLKKRVQQLGIEGFVEFLGETPNNRVAEFLKLSNVVVFPSTAESSSIACAEAFAVGTPVVASRVGGLVELVGEKNERGTLVTLVGWQGSDYAAPLTLPKERLEDLANAIVDCLSIDQSEKISKSIEFAQEELDWGKITERTIRVYENSRK